MIPWEWVFVVESTPAYGVKLRISDHIVHLDQRQSYPLPFFSLWLQPALVVWVENSAGGL